MTLREMAWTQFVEALRCAMSSHTRLKTGAFEDRLFEERRICESGAEAADWGRKAVKRSLVGPLVPKRRTA